MGTPEFRVLNGHRIGLGDFPEERFHFPGRQEGNQDPAGAIPIERPYMGHVSRPQQAVAWRQTHPFWPHFEDKFAFQDVEPLLLVKVQVPGRAAFLMEGVLQNKKAGTVIRCDFEIHLADAQPANLIEAILTLADKDSGGKDRSGYREVAHFYRPGSMNKIASHARLPTIRRRVEQREESLQAAYR
ncbi:MAG TPA: hypothetical protein VFF68_13270 [Anaerolineaceae bacterium]|nr:hypothetical protein [Anaerolineaceae bacterium]